MSLDRIEHNLYMKVQAAKIEKKLALLKAGSSEGSSQFGQTTKRDKTGGDSSGGDCGTSSSGGAVAVPGPSSNVEKAVTETEVDKKIAAALNEFTQQLLNNGTSQKETNKTLEGKLDVLQLSYNTLETNYKTLEGNYKTLEGRLECSETNYKTLEGRYKTLEVSYKTLKKHFDKVLLELEVFKSDEKVFWKQLGIRMKSCEDSLVTLNKELQAFKTNDVDDEAYKQLQNEVRGLHWKMFAYNDVYNIKKQLKQSKADDIKIVRRNSSGVLK